MEEKTTTFPLPGGIRYCRVLNAIQAVFFILLFFLMLAFTALVLWAQVQEAGREIWPETVFFVLLIFGVIFSFFTLLPAMLLLSINRGLKQRKTSARVCQVLVSCFFLLGFPIGTILYGISLYFMLGNENVRRAFQGGPVTAEPVHATGTKRLPGITIFSWWFILSGVFALPAVWLFRTPLFEPYREITALYEPWLTSFYLALTGVLFVLGFFLLKRVEWARKVLLGGISAGLAVDVLAFPRTLSWYREFDFQGWYAAMLARQGIDPAALDAVGHLIPTSLFRANVISGHVMYGIFCVILLVYFTRPKVKQQFIRQA